MPSPKQKMLIARMMDRGFHPYQAAWAAGAQPRDAEHIAAQLAEVKKTHPTVGAQDLILIITIGDAEKKGRPLSENQLSNMLDLTTEDMTIWPDRWTGRRSRMADHLTLIVEGKIHPTDDPVNAENIAIAKETIKIICQRSTLRILTPGNTLFNIMGSEPKDDEKTWPREWPWPNTIYIEDEYPGPTASELPSMSISEIGSGADASGLISPHIINSVTPITTYRGTQIPPDTTFQGLLIGGQEEPRTIIAMFSHKHGTESPTFYMDLAQGKVTGEGAGNENDRRNNARTTIAVARYLQATSLSPEPVPNHMKTRQRKMGAWPGWMLADDKLME